MSSRSALKPIAIVHNDYVILLLLLLLPTFCCVKGPLGSRFSGQPKIETPLNRTEPFSHEARRRSDADDECARRFPSDQDSYLYFIARGEMV